MVCRGLFWGGLSLYLGALALFAVGTFGLRGAPRDPLSGIFLIPLGLPWTHLVDLFPEPLWPWVVVAAPALNLLMLRLVCKAGPLRR